MDFITGGVLAIFVGIGYKLHLDAVWAERRRADDHRKIAETWQAIAAEKDKQIAILMSRGQT